MDAAVEQAKAALGEGLTPLEYVLSVMRDESQPVEIRLEAAGKAAPYVHKRQPTAVEVQGNIMAAYQPPPVYQLPLPPSIARRLAGE